VTGGLVLLGWFAYLWFAPVPAPYQYELVKEGNPKDFPELELDAWPDLQLKQYDVQVADVRKPVAQVTLAQDGNTPVLLNWQNNTRDILHTLDRKPSEFSAVATAIKAHAEQDALILGWWDTSRQINLLTGHETLFNSHMNEPLIIPLDWVEQSGSIQDYEKQFWQSSTSQQERDLFKQFGKALTATPAEGIAQLRALVGSERNAYLIIHVTDLYRLGLIYPDKLGVAYQNLPLTGNLHGMINQMKVQLDQNDFDTYTLQSISDSEIRVFFLSDEQSSETLIAKMLPFTEKDSPLELDVAQVTYQHGSYWVYKIP
jgi:hydroxylamine oxidation protein HaoB